MDTKRLSAAVGHLGNLAILAGLILVVVEIDQNSQLVEAQLESDEFAAWVAIDLSKQGEDFSEVLAKAIATPADLTLAEMVELDGYLYSYLDLLWRREALHGLGIGTDVESEIRATIDDYFGNAFAQAWWEATKFKYAAEFIDTFEPILAEVSPAQDQDFFEDIRISVAGGV